MRARGRKTASVALIALASLVACNGAGEVDSAPGAKIPITTSSDEARELFLRGRDLADKIRQAEARGYFEQAVEKDPRFALGHLALANTARSAQEFFDELERAVELSEEASEGERLLILGTDAGSRGDPLAQRQSFTRLVEIHPLDERAHFALAGFYFARQEFDRAIEAYREATEINPEFSPAYNLIGYAYRSAGRFEQAEEAFKRYIELIPDEPNPYDSYAEFLMKMGRFEESIGNYEKALTIDSRFVPSYVGIGNNQMFLGRGEEARRTLAELLAVARNDGERRQALFWTAASYLHEGDYEAAGAECRKMHALAEASEDWAQVAGDLALMGNILLEAGRPDEALAEFDKALEAIARADVNEDVKEAFHRNHLYREARAALEQDRLERVRELTEAFAEAVASRNIPAEVRRVHELQGLIAHAAGDYREAISDLAQANQQDPRVLYQLALAHRAVGELEEAREVARTAAEWNQLGLTYAFVRGAARRLAAELR